MNGYPHNVEHALSNVRAYYDQWRALSEAESSAIRSGQWMHVDRIQESKRNLQQFIAGATQDMRSQCVASGLDLDLVEARLRDVINDLIHMETSNGRALADQMRAAREQRRADSRPPTGDPSGAAADTARPVGGPSDGGPEATQGGPGDRATRNRGVPPAALRL